MRWRILWRRVGEDDVFILASATAYAAVLSVFPLLLAVIALLSRFVDQPQAQATVLAALGPYLPDETRELVRETIVAVTRTRGAAGVAGIVGLLWGATAVAGSLRQALNRVLGARPRSFWRRKLTDLALVALGGVFLSLSVLGSAALAVLHLGPLAGLHVLAALPARLGGNASALVLSAAVSLLFSGLAFFIAYRFLPNRRLPARSLLWGTLVGALLFEVLKRGFFWYLRTLADYPLVYGPIAGLIVFMVWVYLAAVVVLLGAEVMRFVQDSAEEHVRGG